ncbi:FHA domain-containing protein [Rhodobacter capsulatus]|uniref:FHA domain-containing protein n=2 Tax=Rhodobacter capsulatus TaxID=1061 RepID=A0A0Q0UFS5_RHOCA|nr:FHA domain-containing protein [Rhodobacter capsulatus]KQB12748.1 hypothetical protein AP073_06525 [Rhodobacter capsulatus]KQB15352.1 hypothetical protein AP071_14435 [Rhodobacter capsulatus]PZX26335.1 FHA domain-containing protein [Rhodobacter capsulatus]QNR61827.1 FHA domain-containing protein [Rhodobacter capsulatus]WER10783.1 FHA domain-containing protein [Rhodobacter capsulatus]
MAGSGSLEGRAAASLLLAAGTMDLLTVYGLVQLAEPFVAREAREILPAEVAPYANAVLILFALGAFWVVTDVVLSGHSPGRIALGLSMRDREGRPLSLPRRITRAIGRVMFGGLTGLRVTGLAGYDRMAGTVWYGPLGVPPTAARRIAFLNGRLAGRSVALGKLPGYAPAAPIRIGRDRKWAQLPLDDPRVSGQHCLLRVEGGMAHVRDLGSQNGTLINGRPVTPQKWSAVPPGAEISVAGLRLLLR